MSLREKMNRHPRLAYSAVGITCLLAAGVVVQQIRARPNYSSIVPNFFTTDDSSPESALAALFKDDTSKLPPFEKEGKTAYRAYVFTTDGGKTRFIGYLERYTPEGKQLLEDVLSGKRGDLLPDQLNNQLARKGIEVKKPGDREWVLQSTPAAGRVMAITPPGGGDMAKLQSVFP